MVMTPMGISLMLPVSLRREIVDAGADRVRRESALPALKSCRRKEARSATAPTAAHLGALSREEIQQRPLRRLRRLLRQEVPARYAAAAGVARPAPPHVQGIGAGGGNAMIAPQREQRRCDLAARDHIPLVGGAIDR